MDAEQYTVSHLVMDERFRNWVLKGGDDFWDTWLEKHPEKIEVVNEARYIIQAMYFRVDELTDKQYAQLSNNILQEVNKYEKNNPVKNKPLWQRKWNSYYVAASIVGVIAFCTLLFFWLQNLHTVVYTTTYGQTQQIALPDGSTVFLNANSSLRFSSKWHQHNQREVWLEGEAFFMVRKKQIQHQAIKFIVHTDDVQIEVLGTAFTVAKRNTNTRVILSEGKIRLGIADQAAGNNIVMQPGDWIEYEALQQKITRKIVNAQAYSSWTKKKWILENTSLKQVGIRIEETFGLEVVIADAQLANESMTGVIPIETLSEALDVLAATYNVKIKKENNRLIITRSLLHTP